jgi:hypothetical protein
MEEHTMPTTTVPVNITPEASERIAQRGLQAPIDQMIDQAVKMVPGIRRVEISLEGPYDTHDEPYLEAAAYRDYALANEDISEEEAYAHWKVETFPPDVLWQVSLHLHWDWPNAR